MDQSSGDPNRLQLSRIFIFSSVLARIFFQSESENFHQDPDFGTIFEFSRSRSNLNAVF